jgi:hypothetical protein
MKAYKKYVVYELNSGMGSKLYQTLREVEFRGWRQNSFDSEEEAIQALIEDKIEYVDCVILTQIHIS